MGSQFCSIVHPGVQACLYACMCAGLSRPLQESEQHVPAGNHVGTIMYTAPEIFRDSRLTKPGDVYAFGIMSKNTICQLDLCDLPPCHVQAASSLSRACCASGKLAPPMSLASQAVSRCTNNCYPNMHKPCCLPAIWLFQCRMPPRHAMKPCQTLR